MKAPATPPPSTGEQLLALIEGATPEDLGPIDAEIAALAAKLDGLRAVRKLLASRLAPPGGARPGPVRPPRGPRAPANPAGAADRRKAIAEYLSRNGAAGSAAIARALGIPYGSITSLLKHEWFAPSAQGYHLTPVGRAAALEE